MSDTNKKRRGPSEEVKTARAAKRTERMAKVLAAEAEKPQRTAARKSRNAKKAAKDRVQKMSAPNVNTKTLRPRTMRRTIERQAHKAEALKKKSLQQLQERELRRLKRLASGFNRSARRAHEAIAKLVLEMKNTAQ